VSRTGEPETEGAARLGRQHNSYACNDDKICSTEHTRKQRAAAGRSSRAQQQGAQQQGCLSFLLRVVSSQWEGSPTGPTGRAAAAGLPAMLRQARKASLKLARRTAGAAEPVLYLPPKESSALHVYRIGNVF